MQIAEKLKCRLYRLSIKKRLTYSNVLMFLIPVVVTIATAVIALGIAFYAFVRFYLPRMGLTLKGIREMGEQYEKDLKSFAVLVAVLLIVMLAMLVLSIIVTNRFLTRFIFRRVEEPLELLTGAWQRSVRANWTIRFRMTVPMNSSRYAMPSTV